MRLRCAFCRRRRDRPLRAEITRRWTRILRRLHRLCGLQRIWAYLGHYLQFYQAACGGACAPPSKEESESRAPCVAGPAAWE
eukprot:3948015-Heterocapsa_arctica.AAC.1